MPTPENQFNAFNYLVPATGTTSGFVVGPVDFSSLGANGYAKNWAQLAVDAAEFHPSGVVIDNTKANAALTVTIVETGQNIVAQAGEYLQVNYPAPIEHSVTVISSSLTLGDGNASVIFVDYPVIPYRGPRIPPGRSGNGAVDNTGTQVAIPAGKFTQHATIQNVDAANTLYLSFTNPATVNDFALTPGQAMTFPGNGFSNPLYGRSSAAGGTKFAIIGA